MSLTEYAPTSDSSSSPDQIDVIVTSCGGEDMPRAAYRGGSLVGMESTKARPPGEIPVEFVDWPFLQDDLSFDQKWESHLDVVKREKPKYAVAPDIEDESSLNSTLAKADRLRRHAEIVIVVPKGVKPDRVPSRFRIGLPAQDRFGGVPWPVWEYRNCRSVHILGGSPHRQFELSHYVPVHSVDTASPLKAAQFGSVWQGDKWGEDGYNYYDRIERSMENVLKSWNDDERVDSAFLNRRRREIEHPQAPSLLESERKARPPSRDELCIGPEEEHPFPGRAYFYRDDTLSYPEWKEEYRGESPAWL